MAAAKVSAAGGPGGARRSDRARGRDRSARTCWAGATRDAHAEARGAAGPPGSGGRAEGTAATGQHGRPVGAPRSDLAAETLQGTLPLVPDGRPAAGWAKAGGGKPVRPGRGGPGGSRSLGPPLPSPAPGPGVGGPGLLLPGDAPGLEPDPFRFPRPRPPAGGEVTLTSALEMALGEFGPRFQRTPAPHSLPQPFSSFSPQSPHLTTLTCRHSERLRGFFLEMTEQIVRGAG